METLSLGRAVALVGIGAQTAVGRSALASAAAVRAGIGNFAEHPYMSTAAGEPVKVARASWLSDDLRATARMLALVEGALDETSRLPQMVSVGRKLRLGVQVGIPAPRPGLPPELDRIVSDRLHDLFEGSLAPQAVETYRNGHAAGVLALQRGCELILNGRVDCCFAGGVDSYLDPESLLQIEARKQLHAAGNPWGFIPGEAAGFCLLASQEIVKRLQLVVVADVVSVAVANEKNLINTKTVCTGAGLCQSVGEALKVCPSEKVQQIVCDLNGEPYRADEFGFMVTRFARRFSLPPNFRTPADCWGDVGAASGPLFAALIAASGMRGYAEGEYALLSASSETGERGAAILRTLAPPRR